MTEIKQRDEGGILDWATLDEEQRAAGLKAHRRFVAMADRPDEDAAPKGSELLSFLPRLEAHRGNHTILIDGTRGSGKTAVMLRLLQDWSNSLWNPSDSKPNSRAPEPYLQPPPKNGAQLVPVGLLDLEAVPPMANLAARIAGMFERVVSAMERRGTKTDRTPPAPSWALLQDDTLKSRQKWASFVSAAALEWDRSLERRRATIDPEAYVVEVEQAERKGLLARDCFRDFIDELVKDWQAWHQQERRPFFIVPIDDADLNPARVVELIGLMRTLRHPRVGYLLTGDSGLFMHVLTTHFRAQMDTPLLGGPTTWGSFRVQLVPDEGRQAERLARDYYHKAVSLENCVKLPPLPPATRLAFIRSALSRETMAPLAHYLGADDLSPRALPERWRKLVDLRDYVESNEDCTPQRLALQIWNDALDESYLGEHELDELREFVKINDGRLEFNSTTAVSIRTDTGSGPGLILDPSSFSKIHVYLEQEFRLGLGAQQWPTEANVASFKQAGSRGRASGATIVQLDDSLVAAWLLTSNVALSFPVDPLSMILVGTSTKVLSANKEYWLQLVWPRFLSGCRPFEFQRLFAAWNSRALPQSKSGAGGLVRLYLSLMLEMASTLNTPVMVEAIDALGVQVLEWDDLASKIVDLSSWPYFESFSLTAALLAAPEWGLPPDDANSWLRALKKQDRLGNFLGDKLRKCRVEMIGASAMVNVDSTLRELGNDGSHDVVTSIVLELDKRAGEYAWTTSIGQAPNQSQVVRSKRKTKAP